MRISRLQNRPNPRKFRTNVANLHVSPLIRSIAAGAAAIAVAIGAYAIGNSSSSNGASATPNAPPPAQSGQAPPIGQVP
jgi:hypothetical protein